MEYFLFMVIETSSFKDGGVKNVQKFDCFYDF